MQHSIIQNPSATHASLAYSRGRRARYTLWLVFPPPGAQPRQASERYAGDDEAALGALACLARVRAPLAWLGLGLG